MLRIYVFVTLFAFALSACGNKGPLVMPEKTPPAQQDKDKAKDKNAPANSTQPAKASDGGANSQ